MTMKEFLKLAGLKYDDKSFRYKNERIYIDAGLVMKAEKEKDLRGLAQELLKP